jgi:hypothetical protein
VLGHDDGVDPFQDAAYGLGPVRYHGAHEVLQRLAFYQPLSVFRFVAVPTLDVPATRTDGSVMRVGYETLTNSRVFLRPR